MRKTTKSKTREQRKPSPGQTFALWIRTNHPEPNERKLAKEFTEWVNSAVPESEPNVKIKTIFLELTRLTVEHVHKQIDLGSRGLIRRYKAGVPYVKKINTILDEIRERYPAGPNLRDVASASGGIAIVDRPLVDDQLDLSRWDEVHAANYALKQYRLLVEQGAFATLRHCALRTCNRHFFPLRTEARYCSKGCQSKHYTQAHGRKKLNAAAQKLHYYTRKVLDLAKLSAVNPAFQKKYQHAKKALKLAEIEKRAASRKRG